MSKNHYEIPTTNEVDMNVEKRVELICEGEREKVKEVLRVAFNEIEEKKVNARLSGISDDQAKIEVELDFGAISDIVKKEVEKMLQSKGWTLCYSGKLGSIILRSY